MGGFGDILGSIGELLGGLGEAASEAAPEIAAEAALRGRGDATDANAARVRYLTGGPRTLNVNDR